MTTEFRLKDISPRQLISGKELDRIAATSVELLTSEEIGHHAYSIVNHFIQPGIGWLRLAANDCDQATVAKELEAIRTTAVPAVLAAVASKLPGDVGQNTEVLGKKLEIHLRPILERYTVSAMPRILLSPPFLAWAEDVEKHHSSLI